MATSKKNGRRRGKRPTATIDLKAKEVASSDKSAAKDPAASTPAASSASKDAAKSGSDKPAEGRGTTGAQQSSASAKPSTPSPQSGAAGDGKSASSKSATSDMGSAKSSSAATGATASAAASGKPTAPGSTADTAVRTDRKTPEKPADNDTSSGKGGFGGAFTHLVAGGLGGLIAMFGMQQFAGTTTPPVTGATDNAAITEALESRLAVLETRVESPATAPTATLDPAIVDRITKLESLNATLAELSNTQTQLVSRATDLQSKVGELSDPSGGGAAELRTRLDAMEGTISSLAKSAEGSSGKAIPKLAALAGRINDMQTELGARIAATSKAVTDATDKKIGLLSETITKADTVDANTTESLATLSSGNERLSRTVETVKAQSEQLGKDIAGLVESDKTVASWREGLNKTASSLATRLEKLEGDTTTNLAALPSRDDLAAAIAPVAEKLGDVETRIASVLKREATRASSAKQIVLALELSNLRRAVDRGQSVKAEIERIKASAPEGIDLAALDKLAKEDVPTAEALSRQFGKIAGKIIGAETADENAGTFDKLFANARSIIKVRKIGDVEGATTEAIVARAENDLRRNDIKAALSEVQTLKGLAAEVAADWAGKARDRLAVDAVLEKIEAGLKTSVSGATN